MKHYQQLRQHRMTLKEQSQQLEKLEKRNAELVIEKYDLERKLCQCRKSKEEEYNSLQGRYRIEVILYTFFLLLIFCSGLMVGFPLPVSARIIADLAVLGVIMLNGFRFIFAKTI